MWQFLVDFTQCVSILYCRYWKAQHEIKIIQKDSEVITEAYSEPSQLSKMEK